jgi:hypothetical protein
MSRVILIAWDGADWRILDPLLEQGALPNRQALLDKGQREVTPLGRPHALLVGLADHGVYDILETKPGDPQAVPGHLPLDQGADVPRRPHGRWQEPAPAERHEQVITRPAWRS